MAKRAIQRATLNEVLAFLKSRGVMLSDEGIRLLTQKMEEEPIGKPTLERSKNIIRNPLFKQILDHTFIKRSKRIQQIAESNPILQLIDEKRKRIQKGKDPSETPMPEYLRRIFFDESKWHPYIPYVKLPKQGQIVKTLETEHPDKPYISYICLENGKSVLYSTRRHIELTQLPEARFYKLRDGIFKYEIDEVIRLEKGYLEYIMQFHVHI